MAKKNTPRSASTSQPSLTKGQPDGGMTKAQQRALRAQQQQAELAARKRKETTRRVVLTSVAVVALAALVVVLVIVGKNHSSGGSGTTAEPKQYWLNVGNPKAPHKVTVYEDFLCPYCGHLELESETKLQAEAKAGDVYISYRPFFLLKQDGSYSGDAVNAYLAVKEIAGDDVALQFHNLLYHNQPDESAVPSDPNQFITGLANQVVPKADQAKVDDAISKGTYNSAVTQITNWVEGPEGVSGTPTVYFDGKIYNDTSGTHTDPTYGGYENMADNLIKAVQKK